MKRFALVGGTVAHSKSPAMFEAAFRALDLSDHRYEAIEVKTDRFEAALRSTLLDYEGLNVTAPLKEVAFRSSTVTDGSSLRIGAVNTLCRGRLANADLMRDSLLWIGVNTDAGALARDLRRCLPNGTLRRAVVLGTGGAARAAMEALAQLEATTVEVRARVAADAARIVHTITYGCTSQSRGRLHESLRETAHQETVSSHSSAVHPSATHMRPTVMHVEAGEWGSALAADCDLVVQATSDGNSGMSDGLSVLQAIDWTKGRARPYVYDVIYSPAETPLLRTAKTCGLSTANGLGMLVEQAIRSLEIWTGRTVARDVMMAAATESSSSRVEGAT